MKRAPKKKPQKSAAAKSTESGSSELLQQLADLEAERDRYKLSADSADQTKHQLKAARERITQAQADYAQAVADVANAKQAVKDAEAERKETREAVDAAIADALTLVERWTSGVQLLPFPPDEPAATGAAPDASSSSRPPRDPAAEQPIGVLGQKSIAALIGKEEVAKLKSIEEPVGLSDKELDALEGAGLDTIGKLEARMRKDDFWHRDITGFGTAKINKLINTLRVYRQRNPMPTEPTDTAPTGTGADVSTASPAPPEPDTDAWKQACYHLREIVNAAQTLQEQGHPDCIEPMGETAAQSIELELAINQSQALSPEQKEQIAALAATVERWKRGTPPDGGAA